MNRKSGTSKASADRLVKTIRRKTRQTYSAEEKIRIVLRVFAARKASRRCAVGKASPRACITVGPRSSLRPANAVCPVIRQVRRRRLR